MAQRPVKTERPSKRYSAEVINRHVGRILDRYLSLGGVIYWPKILPCLPHEEGKVSYKQIKIIPEEQCVFRASVELILQKKLRPAELLLLDQFYVHPREINSTEEQDRQWLELEEALEQEFSPETLEEIKEKLWRWHERAIFDTSVRAANTFSPCRRVKPKTGDRICQDLWSIRCRLFDAFVEGGLVDPE